MKSVAGAQISPDGRYVAYTVQQANWDDNEFATQIWIAVSATGERYQLTAGKRAAAGRNGRRILAAWHLPAIATASVRST